MNNKQGVDVAINVFAKPFQTALSILSLLQHSGDYIDKIYFQFEPVGSKYDSCSPYIIAEYLKEKSIVFQPQHWIALNSVTIAQLYNPTYRHAIRYQYAWEHTDKKYLFIIHNDVFFLKDILGPLIHTIDSSFAIGRIGQCWNCPASYKTIVDESMLGCLSCQPNHYQKFQPTFEELNQLYIIARQKNIFIRPYLEDSPSIFYDHPWTLPECRVNEWACLVNMEISAPLTCPLGPVLPFGAFLQCGTICLDTSVAWFKGMHVQGKIAKHFDIHSYMSHWVGSGKMTHRKYIKAEENAMYFLKKYYPHFISWCITNGILSSVK